MVTYTLIPSKRQWNSLISGCRNFHPYQISEWGEYKRGGGWTVLRIQAVEKDQTAFVQICFKKKFPILLGWIVGSVMGHAGLFRKTDLLGFLRQQFNCPVTYLRANFSIPSDPKQSLALFSAGWQKCPRRILTDYSLAFDLEKGLDQIRADFSANWRRNLKRGTKKNTDVRIVGLDEFHPEQIADLFEQFKAIKSVPLPDLEEIKKIRTALGQQIRVAVSRIESELVGLRAFFCSGDQAVDFWAAAVGQGRRCYTSHVLLWELIRQARSMGIRTYDLSGIDPVSNPTVYRFKNGTRCRVVEKLGEWELHNSRFFSLVANGILTRYL